MALIRRTIAAALFATAVFAPAQAQQRAPLTVDPSQTAIDAKLEGYTFTTQTDRFTVFTSRVRRGKTASLDDNKLKDLCSDFDGCTVRIAMHNWDGTGRFSSSNILFFLNAVTGNWQASSGNAGSDKDNVVQHVIQYGSCYMTDGEYENQTGTDKAAGFGLLSGNEANADCVVTIID